MKESTEQIVYEVGENVDGQREQLKLIADKRLFNSRIIIIITVNNYNNNNILLV